MNPAKKKSFVQRIENLFRKADVYPAKSVEIRTPAPSRKAAETQAAVHPVKLEKTMSFYGLGIAPGLLEMIAKLKFVTPTPIQHKTIPIALEGKDIMGIAQTGTGKTLAFCIPVYQRLAQMSGRALVLVPTRELAIQVDEVFRQFGPAFDMRTALIIGGAPMYDQIMALRRNPRTIIATPGRLIDHIRQSIVNIADVNIVVLDEADRMLDMGFMPQIDIIFKCVNPERQTMLFSATIPQEIMRIASAYMKMPVSVQVAPSGTVADKITQELFVINKEAKMKLLEKLLRQYHGSVLLFTRTKHSARNIARRLKAMRFSAADIHSDRTLSQRREALDGFKSGRYRVLVATDIASRGIDVKGIEVVINYDIPDDPENYVHRIGRTGRIGMDGHAVTFATREQSRDVQNIERLIKSSLRVLKHPEVPSDTFSYTPSGENQGRIYQGGYNRHQHGPRNPHRGSYSGPRSSGHSYNNQQRNKK